MDDSDLVRRAAEAGRYAHAPYSQYRVGAAVLGSDGRVWTGCNVENVSYGLTICAERVAIFKMVSEGILAFAKIAIVTLDGGTPCGACRQVLAEFCTEPRTSQVIVATERGAMRTFTLADLLPHGFTFEAVGGA